MVARLAPAYRERLLKLLLALADARPDEVVRAARTMGQELPDHDGPTFERAVARVVGRVWGALLADIELGTLLLELIREAGESGLRMDRRGAVALVVFVVAIVVALAMLTRIMWQSRRLRSPR